MLNKIVCAVLLLTIISSAAFASSFKKGDVVVCDKDKIQIQFLQDVSASGAKVRLRLANNQLVQSQANIVMFGDMLDIQIPGMYFSLRANDIVKTDTLRVLVGTDKDGDRNSHTANCTVK